MTHDQGPFRLTAAMTLVVCLVGGATLRAQDDAVHYRHQGLAPPGAVGSAQLERGGPLPGYFQPVEIHAPEGVRISLAVDGEFAAAQPAGLNVGLLVGSVYRLRVSNIPNFEGLEIFPTVEMIDRLYPPPGEERRFPVPVELTQQDLELALEGKFVTRVIYLEDPQRALPVNDDPEHQNWFDTGPGENPLQEADRWGRPLAILRLGGRVPDNRDTFDEPFLYGSPPFTVFRPSTPVARKQTRGLLAEAGPDRPVRPAANSRRMTIGLKRAAQPRGNP